MTNFEFDMLTTKLESADRGLVLIPLLRALHTTAVLLWFLIEVFH